MSDDAIATRLAVLETKHHSHNDVCAERYKSIQAGIDDLHKRISSFKAEVAERDEKFAGVLQKYQYAVIGLLMTIVISMGGYIVSNLDRTIVPQTIIERVQ